MTASLRASGSIIQSLSQKGTNSGIRIGGKPSSFLKIFPQRGMTVSLSIYAEEWLPRLYMLRDGCLIIYILLSGNDRFMRQPLWRWDNQWTREHVHELSLEEGRKTKSGQTCYMKPSRLGTRDELGVGFLSGY